MQFTKPLWKAAATLFAAMGLSLAVGTAEAEVLNNESAPIPEELNLETAQRIALENNPDIEAARTRIEQAEARMRQARAGYFPTVEITAGYNKNWLPRRDVREARREATARPFQELIQQLPRTLQAAETSEGIAQSLLPQIGGRAVTAWRGRNEVKDSFIQYQGGITARWTVFDGFGREFRFATARTGAEKSRAGFREAQRQLLSAVAQTYYFAQLAREEIEIAEANVAFNERQLEEAKARREAGTGSLSDELTFEVRLNAARNELISAREDYDLALIAILELLGHTYQDAPPTFEFAPLPNAEEAIPELPDSQTLHARAEENRPDLEQEELALEQAGQATGAERSAYYPRVSLRASREGKWDDSVQISDSEFSTNVGVDISYEVFAGGQNRAAVGEARAAESEARHELRRAELKVMAEVDERRRKVRSAMETLRLQETNVELVKRNRDLVERGFEVGEESLVRLTEAQRDLVEARGQYAFARVSLHQAWHDLRSATGETVTAHNEYPEP